MKKLFPITAAILMMSPTLVMAKAIKYHCVCTENNNGDKTLVVSKAKVMVTNLDASYGDVGARFSAVYDVKYKPRPSPIVKVRYLGEENGNDRQVILQDTLIKGAKKGYMQIRGSEDSYWSSNFTCTLAAEI